MILIWSFKNIQTRMQYHINVLSNPCGNQTCRAFINRPYNCTVWPCKVIWSLRSHNVLKPSMKLPLSVLQQAQLYATLRVSCITLNYTAWRFRQDLSMSWNLKGHIILWTRSPLIVCWNLSLTGQHYQFAMSSGWIALILTVQGHLGS